MPEQTVTSFRLSPQQARLWSTLPDPGTAVVQGAISLSGAVDGDRLRAAIERLLARHEILRTTYHLPAGMRTPLQAVAADATFSWTVGDADGRAVDELLARERDHAIDLDRGPALRAHLACGEEDRYVLVLTLPALSADAGTFAAIANELPALYAANPRNLEEEPLQYADYAEWQNALGEDEDTAAQRSEWCAQRLEEVAPLELPAACGGETAGSVQARLQLGAETAAAIEAAAAALGIDTPAFVLAAWQAVLSRLSGSSEFAIDVIVDGREDDEFRSALGVLAKPVRIRASVGLDSPFSGLATRANQSLANVARWQEAIAPELGDTLAAAFEWRMTAALEPFGGLSASVEQVWSHDASALVKLTAITNIDGLTLAVSGDARAIAPQTARRVAGNVAALLSDAATDATAAIGALELLGDEDKRLLASLNDTSAEIPAVKGVHHLFEQQAAATPERPSVAAGGAVLSYEELNSRANQLARVLRARGASPNIAVGIFLERSIESIVALLGALKAGAAALPLSVEHPPARLEHQLRDSGASVVITLARFADRLPQWDGAIVRLDDDADALRDESDEDLEPLTTLDDLAYIVYTSGSTGLPKGVGVTHRGIVNYACDMRRRLSLDGAEPRHFALVSPLITDLGNTSVYPSLVSGGCLHVIDESAARDGMLYAAYASGHPIDVLKITPSHLTALLATGDPRLVLPRRLLVLGGERASWELVETALSGGCAVLNHYGPTETTVGSLTYPITVSVARARRTTTVPIGQPIANTDVLILDRAGAPAPVGVAGELCIGGAGLARGYVGRPEETAERFVQHPTRPGDRMYLTGDLARLEPGGPVEFLGRIDRQVKIRGFRVEPAEVEGALLRHPHVGQAAVVTRQDNGSDPSLVAYVVPSGAVDPTAQELSGHVAGYVPDYMVPSAFVAIDALPLTANGKLDVSALPAPDQSHRNGHGTHQAPRDEVERQLAEIWTEVLGVEEIGVDEDFFELGGHSLLATQVIARIRSRLEAQLPLHVLFTSPTVAGLAAAVAETRVQAEPGEEELAAMLEELEGMSDEDAERLLRLESAAEE